MKEITLAEKDFIRESNFIENERGFEAFNDAMKAWLFIRPCCVSVRPDMIKKIHRRLMKRINPRIAGKYRKVNVRVGRHVCLDHHFILPRLNYLCQTDPKTEQEIKDWHIKFEEIHPFEDGNGRTGRIIMNFHRIKIGLPILVIHEGKEQFEYYNWFKK